jgi:mono/diheme cytochrome c family protein
VVRADVVAVLLRFLVGSAAPLAYADVAAAAAAADPGVHPVQQGELLFNAGGCTNCHTAKDGPVLAGGDAIRSPYGSFYAPNITPDPETGIGGWSDGDFIRAMREGRSPEGESYYPSFPYTSYTRMGDEDLKALKAYLDKIPPVRRESRPHELSFPYDQRWGMNLWQWAFFEPARFQPDPARDATWNRGAYLVQGPGHCGECHTPRDRLGVLQLERAYAGAQLGKETVPNLTGHPEKGLGKWSQDDVVALLKIGMLPDADFVGSEMAKVVNNGTSKLPDADLAAMAAYLKSLPPVE